MTALQRLMREPNLITGFVVALLGLLVAFGLELTKEQTAAALLFVGAVVALIRHLVTPASEVVAQQKPGEALPVAGPASPVEDGTPVVEVHYEQ